MYTYPEQETSKRMRKIAPAESESETCPNCHSYSPPLCNNNGLVAGQSHWAKLLPDNDKLLQHSIGRTHATNGCFNQMAAAGTGNILLSSYPSSSTFKLPQSSSSKQVSRQLLHSSRGVSFSFAGFSLVALTGVALLVIGLCTTLSSGAAEKLNHKQLFEHIQKFDSCIIPAASFSFLLRETRPAETMDEFRVSCKRQLDAVKCIKEGTKNSPALVRRAMATFANQQQQHNKKYCSSFTSPQARQSVEILKCINRNKAVAYSREEQAFANSLLQLRSKNMTDSALELKYICCSLYTFRRRLNQISRDKPVCVDRMERIDEMLTSLFPSEIDLLCDDEEKLVTKVCPNLEPLKDLNKPYVMGPGVPSPSALAIYLVLTLGEPEPSR